MIRKTDHAPTFGARGGRVLDAFSATWSDLRRQPSSLLRSICRAPLAHQAQLVLETLTVVELGDLVADNRFTVTLPRSSGRHEWSLGTAEQLIVQVLIAGRDVSNVFEIGTFNGGTTALMAEALPPDGTVVTVDLPDDLFRASQAPPGFDASAVGCVYRASPAAHKVTQLRADSLRLDSSTWRRSADLVLVDGCHDYTHGCADTATALQVVRPGGIILWDDFQPYWDGLVRGIVQAMNGRRLQRLAGSSLAVHVAPLPAH
jgi:predicted O-methyltransferase YrrM